MRSKVKIFYSHSRMENLPAPLETLIKVYKQYESSKERKAAYLKSEEGKEYNRKKAAAYYEKNKAAVQERNLARYHANKAEKPAEELTEAKLKAKATKAAYYQNNKEKILERNRKYYHAKKLAASKTPAEV